MAIQRSLDDSFQPGDLVFFAGRGLESRWIALVTCTPWQWAQRTPFSHVGICARDPHNRGRVLIFESTTLCDLPCAITGKKEKGVQAHFPSERIRNYPGKVWRLAPTIHYALKWQQGARLTDFLMSEIGKPYDYEGAMISATNWLRLCEWMYPTLDKVFCSYLCMAALKYCEMVDKDLNPRAYSPARMARKLPYWGLYNPIGRGRSAKMH